MRLQPTTFALLILGACADSGSGEPELAAADLPSQQLDDSDLDEEAPVALVKTPSALEVPNLIELHELGAAGEALTASAPPGLTENDLGRPFNADFTRLQGSAGKPLFPNAGTPKRTPQRSMEHRSVRVSTEAELAANASAWGIPLGNIRADMTTRYASHRALQIVEVVEIDDTTSALPPPDEAVYYPAKIYLGYSYEGLVSGDSADFSSTLHANLGAVNINLSAEAGENNLEFQAFGRGLNPTGGKSIFADDPKKLEAAYSVSGQPVPVLVEWRMIPGRSGRAGQIAWSELKEGCAGAEGCAPCQRWRFDRMIVSIPRTKANGSAWDAGGTPPEVVLSLTAAGREQTTRFKGTKADQSIGPIEVMAGEAVGFSAVDKDLMNDDPIGSGTTPIREFHSPRSEFGGSSAVELSSRDSRTKVTLLGQCAG